MRIVTYTSLVIASMVVMTACAPNPAQPGQVDQPRLVSTQSRGVVDVQLGNGFKAMSAAKTYRDVDHFHLQLVDLNGHVVVEDNITGQAGRFIAVPDGEYRLVADALDANDYSLVEGGEQTSQNTVTVSEGASTYSDDSGVLYVSLQLLNGSTGDGTIRNAVDIIDGQPATTQPQLVPSDTM